MFLAAFPSRSSSDPHRRLQRQGGKKPAPIIPDKEGFYETLKELSANFETVVRPLNPTPEEATIQTKTGLAQSTQALRNRMEEANQVRTLIKEVKSKSR